MYSLREQERDRTERIRGWIVYFLFKNRPKPMEFGVLMRCLDRRNFPLSRRRLAEEMDYLRSERFIRIFPNDSESELDEVQQSKMVQRYSDCESDEDMGHVLCAKITTAGTNFQEGRTKHDGIQRVE